MRFAKDKSPYKTHIGGLIPVKRSGKKVTDMPMALYFHVGDKEKFGAAGHYMMEAESLTRFRANIVDAKRSRELDKILAALTKKGFTPSTHNDLKRVPKGFDPAHPRAEMLKWRGLTVGFPPLPKGILATPKLVKWLADGCKASAPFVEWLVFATA